MFIDGGSAVAHAQSENADLRIGRPNRRHHPITPGQPDPAKPDIGEPIAFQSPSVHGDDTSKPRKFHIGERLWNVVGYGEGSSLEPKMISNEFTKIVRSEQHFHDVDGACQWCFRHTNRFGKGSQSLTRCAPPKWLEQV